MHGCITKRRTDLKKFFKQVHNSGIARINLYKKYPDSLKLVHLLPGVFTLGGGVVACCVTVAGSSDTAGGLRLAGGYGCGGAKQEVCASVCMP